MGNPDSLADRLRGQLCRPRLPVVNPPPKYGAEDLAKVQYEGSPYHKRHHSPWGAPGLKSDKTECPPEIDPATARIVLEAGLKQSLNEELFYSSPGQHWPKVVWGRSVFETRDGEKVEIVWEAEVTNPATPSYHAYPCGKERHHRRMSRTVRLRLWLES